MLYRRFLLAATIFAMLSLTVRLIDEKMTSMWLENSYTSLNLSYMLFAAAFTLVIPGLVLLLLELGLHRQPPQRLTRISFLLHLCGLMTLLCAVPIMIHDNGISKISNGMLIAGLLMTTISMSLLPAILIIALRNKTT
jgi:hypothetical protein